MLSVVKVHNKGIHKIHNNSIRVRFVMFEVLKAILIQTYMNWVRIS